MMAVHQPSAARSIDPATVGVRELVLRRCCGCEVGVVAGHHPNESRRAFSCTPAIVTSSSSNQAIRNARLVQYDDIDRISAPTTFDQFASAKFAKTRALRFRQFHIDDAVLRRVILRRVIVVVVELRDMMRDDMRIALRVILRCNVVIALCIVVIVHRVQCVRCDVRILLRDILDDRCRYSCAFRVASHFVSILFVVVAFIRNRLMHDARIALRRQVSSIESQSHNISGVVAHRALQDMCQQKPCQSGTRNEYLIDCRSLTETKVLFLIIYIICFRTYHLGGHYKSQVIRSQDVLRFRLHFILGCITHGLTLHNY